MASRFIGIVGATGVGKTAVGVELAKLLGTDVISADSMQIYKHMDIGTAKPTAEEMQGVRHFMLDVVEPNCEYSSFLYQRDASAIIDGMSVPLVVGGTGFYFDSLLYPPEFAGETKALRAELNEKLSAEGLQSLVEMLKELDFETYSRIDLHNPVRVVRALEIAQSGEKKSDGRGKDRQPRYDCTIFALQRDRAEMYRNIDKRVDKMMQAGLVDEAADLIKRYGKLQTSAFSAIGYKEIFRYLDGDYSLEEAVASIKLNTRHYAKRQISYIKRLPIAEYVDVAEFASPREIAEHICKTIIKRTKI